jgi:hypothetical protein
MERLPKFEVIGAVSDEIKEQVIQKQQEKFEKQQELLYEDIKVEFEAAEAKNPKTPEQIAVLNFINEETNRLLVECGAEPFDIPVGNYHILPPEEMKKFFDTKSSGTYSDMGKAIGLSSELSSSLLCFAVVAFHEALHMKSRHVYEVWIGKDGKTKEKKYRSGVRAESPHKKDIDGKSVTHFSGLDEGIVAWQEKLSFLRLLEIPELAKEKEKYYSEKGEIERRRISKERNIPEDEIFWTENIDELKWSGVGYTAQRRVLEYVCEEIKSEFTDEYSTKEDVFRIFLKANFNANLVPIARLMKKTFGPDGLRILAMIKNSDRGHDTNNVLEMLKKLRQRIKSV